MATSGGEGQRQAARRALLLAGLCAAVAGVGTIAWYWLDGLPHGATSGVWMALAHDWSRGVLYRPLMGGDGFGGTRYMPLFFVMLGSLVRAGTPIVVGGVLLTIASSGSDAASVHQAIDAHTSEGVTQFYGEMNFPAGFLTTLWQRYRVHSVPHRFVVLTAVE